mgnify:CR=1 FL=1
MTNIRIPMLAGMLLTSALSWAGPDGGQDWGIHNMSRPVPPVVDPGPVIDAGLLPPSM